jgi:aldehyde:ferredoxin oxidoreductase
LTRAGFSRKDDNLPQRLTQTPAPTGPAKGLVCHLDEMLDEYYRVRGWTPEGIPTQARLKALDLE